MPRPRKQIVDDSRSDIYHCISRTVRQAFLLSFERAPASGDPAGSAMVIDDHRRDWLVERIETLASIFAVDCITSAIMSNHLHMLLRTLPELVEHWSDAEVAYRWLLLHPPRAARCRQGLPKDGPPSRDEVQDILADSKRVRKLRERLSSLSWYMKELKEWLAKKSNREEGRHGAFWEERFSSRRAAGASGLLACAGYIDLNPVAARIAPDPLCARYTGVQAHVRRAGRAGNPEAHELWSRIIAQSSKADTSEDSIAESDLEAFASMFDDAMFTASVPARRESYGVADEWDLYVAPPSVDDGEGTETPETAAVETPRRPRPVPSESLLDMSLGAYFRRLRLMADLSRVKGDEKRESKQADARRRQARNIREADERAIVELATAMTGETSERALDGLGEMLSLPTLRGSIIGEPSSVIAERDRRGARCVRMAMRPGRSTDP